MSLPVSVQICTLNEASNIADCLASVLRNDPQDVVVIDGGSSDGTPDIVRALGVRLIEAGPIGLAGQRELGTPRLPARTRRSLMRTTGWKRPGWRPRSPSCRRAAMLLVLQSCLRVADPVNWWLQGWDQYFIESIAPAADTIMVGRPALFRTDALTGIESTARILVEDTEMSRDFQRRGLRQGIGTAVSYRHCPAGRVESFAKWQGYGRGYRHFVGEHPQRRRALLRHMLFTVPLARAWRPVLRGNVTQPVFGLLMAGNLVAGWLTAGPRD